MESNLPANFPKTLQAAIAYFADPAQAFTAAVALRWPNGITCPRCGSKEHSFISTRKIWFCKSCKKQFTVKVGSIFEDSPLGMDKWMFAAWLVCNCKNGVSSCEVARHLGITQKSAWFMDHRIRTAMQSGSFERDKFTGRVEADETFIGQKARNMHRDVREKKITCIGGKDKTAVTGILERGKDGKIHTNGLENFWSLLKRGLHGTYASVEPFHLFRYLDEQAFRYNNRKDEGGETLTAERFAMVMGNVSGKRLTWKHLPGKDDSSSLMA